MIKQMSKTRIDYTNVFIIIIAGFIIGIVVGFILFSPGLVFGQTSLEQYETMKMDVLNGPYAQTIKITQNATNLTEGYMINNYVKNIENQTINTSGLN